MTSFPGVLLFEIEVVELTTVWAFLGIIGGIGFFISFIRWWLGIPTLLLLALFSLMFSIELYDDLHDAILRQEGPNYILFVNLAIAFGFVLNLTGMAISFVRRTRLVQ